jgi:hypothetical protein
MDTVTEKTCNERRLSVGERIQRHEKWLGAHETKIDDLMKSDATNTNEIKNICKGMGKLTTAIWGLVSAVFALLVGFFIWYIQSL